MKISKVSIITIMFCLAAIVSVAHAAPMIVLIEDNVKAHVEINVDGAVGPASWAQTYSGPAYLGTLFQGADIDIVATTSFDSYAGESLFVNQAPGVFQGETGVGALPPGVGTGVNWDGKTYIKVGWVFKIEGGDTTVDLLAEDQASDGKTALKLIDVTSGTVVASLNPDDSAGNPAELASVKLIDSHVYRLKAYSWARDSGNGDPAGTFNIAFGTGDIIVGK
jgi:hypothetical protein